MVYCLENEVDRRYKAWLGNEVALETDRRSISFPYAVAHLFIHEWLKKMAFTQLSEDEIAEFIAYTCCSKFPEKFPVISQ